VRVNVQVDGHARTELESENASVCALREKRVSTGRFPYLRRRSKAWIQVIPVVGSRRVNHNAFRSRSGQFGLRTLLRNTRRLGFRLPND
jgi:hypothetical protein